MSNCETGTRPGGSFNWLVNRLLPASVLENLKRRVLPFGLARALSMGIPVLVQFCLLWRFGAEESGVFWVLASAATLLAFISDAGAQNAFPILFGPTHGSEHPQLGKVLRVRLLAALLAGAGLVALGRVGKVAAGGFLDRLVLFGLVVGRVILMSHQGFHYSRERFTRLFFAALAENLVAMLGFGGLLVAPALGVGLPCRPAMFALLFFALATWVAIFLLNVPREAWGFGSPRSSGDAVGSEMPENLSSSQGAASQAIDQHPTHRRREVDACSHGLPAGRRACQARQDDDFSPDWRSQIEVWRSASDPLAFLWPYAVSGIGGAVFTKGDAVIAGFLLEPATAGILGVIKAFYRLLTFPVYMSGQGLYPSMRAAWVHRDIEEMERLKHLHRITGRRLLALELLFAGAVCALGYLLMCPQIRANIDQERVITAFWFMLALPVCIPNSFIMPDYFSRQQEWLVAKITVLLAIGRPLLAVLLASRAGMEGMALNHLFFDMLQGAVYTVVIPWREGRFRRGC